MSPFIQALLGGSVGAAIVTGVFTLLKTWIDHRQSKKDHILMRNEQKEDIENVHDKALRYIMLYIIQERAKELIARGFVTVDERRSLHEWHSLYHEGLNGNGDAKALIDEVDRLPLRIAAIQ